MKERFKHVEFLPKSNWVPNQKLQNYIFHWVTAENKQTLRPQLGFLGLNLPIHISRDNF